MSSLSAIDLAAIRLAYLSLKNNYAKSNKHWREGAVIRVLDNALNALHLGGPVCKQVWAVLWPIDYYAADTDSRELRLLRARLALFFRALLRAEQPVIEGATKLDEGTSFVSSPGWSSRPISSGPSERLRRRTRTRWRSSTKTVMNRWRLRLVGIRMT